MFFRNVHRCVRFSGNRPIPLVVPIGNIAVVTVDHNILTIRHRHDLASDDNGETHIGIT